MNGVRVQPAHEKGPRINSVQVQAEQESNAIKRAWDRVGTCIFRRLYRMLTFLLGVQCHGCRIQAAGEGTKHIAPRRAQPGVRQQQKHR